MPLKISVEEREGPGGTLAQVVRVVGELDNTTHVAARKAIEPVLANPFPQDGERRIRESVDFRDDALMAWVDSVELRACRALDGDVRRACRLEHVPDRRVALAYARVDDDSAHPAPGEDRLEDGVSAGEIWRHPG